MFSLQNKNALVTGAGAGIGRAIATLLADAGARVWVADVDAGKARESAEAITRDGGAAESVALDVASDGDLFALAAHLPTLDILVNNAGINHVGGLQQTSAADLDRLYAVNVRGVFNGCKAFVPAMLERGSGSVINTASIAGVLAVRERLAYTMTKHAVVGLTRGLALDHSHTGVRFNAVCPGRVETEMVQRLIANYPDPEAAFREMSATQLNGRMVQPREVAAAVRYLASDEAAMITGSCLMIDGGWGAGK